MNTQILDGLMGASTNIRLAATPMGVYHQASAEGDTEKMKRALGYASERTEKAAEYREKLEEGMEAEAKAKREEAKAERQEALEKAQGERDSTLSHPQKEPAPGVDTVEISETAKAVQQAGQPQARPEVQPVLYSAEGQVCPDTAEPAVSVSA